MAFGAKLVQSEVHTGQRVVGTHHADIVAVVKAQLLKRHTAAGLGLGAQVGQRGGEITHGEVGGAVFKQSPRVARAQRHHPHADAGGVALEHVDQWRDELGGGRISHCQHKGGSGRRR